MSLLLRAAFFEVLGLYSLFSIVTDLRTGNARSRGLTVSVKENPGWFYLVVLCKAAFVAFAFAVLLNLLGLIDDPFIWMSRNLTFLMPK
jgi:hypothetical protein